MQGSYNEIVKSNKNFIGMMDNFNNEAQRKENEMRRASEMSRRITITRRVSKLSIASSIIVSSFIIKNCKRIIIYMLFLSNKNIDSQ